MTFDLSRTADMAHKALPLKLPSLLEPVTRFNARPDSGYPDFITPKNGNESVPKIIINDAVIFLL